MVTIPVGTPASKRYLIAKADGADVIVESSETDNTKAKTLYIGPDLTVFKLTAPTSAVPGQVISVSDTTKNGGGEPTTVVTTTRFYLSTDKKLAASDVPLGPGRSVPVLAAGASNMLVTSVTIPLGTAPGAYYLLGKADDGAVEVESRENNNVKAWAITVD
jgi:subtilase family serine protease